MYELKKIGKVFTSKFVGTGPSSYKKRIYWAGGLTKVEKHCSKLNILQSKAKKFYVKICSYIFNL